MKRILCIILLSLTHLFVYGQMVMTVSDNEAFNAVVKGFRGYESLPSVFFLSFQIEKANHNGDVYRNVLRMWYGKNPSDYINLLYQTFPTKEIAEASLLSYYQNGEKLLIVDWDAVPFGAKNIDLGHTNFYLKSVDAKTIPKKGIKKENISSLYTVDIREVDKAPVIEKPDGKRTRFTLPNYVSNKQDVKVYINNKLQDPQNYIIHPSKKCVVFKKTPKRCSKITVSNAFNLTVVEYAMSFDGLTLENTRYLKGIDNKTGLNTTYFSFDKHNITFKGTQGKAYVELADPAGYSDLAAHFKALAPNDKDIYGEKVRITGSINHLNAVEIINSVDVFIPRAWNALTQQDNNIDWLTVQEYWCSEAGVPIKGEPQFRMTLGILKKAGRGNKLYFDLKAQDLETTLQSDGSWKEKYKTLYELDDRNSQVFEIPLDEWFNLRTEITAGDANSGHFKLIARLYSGKEIVIFDKICQTFATGYIELETKQPLYTSVSPLKLYTSAKTLQLMKGHPLDIFYDNWSFKAYCISYR